MKRWVFGHDLSRKCRNQGDVGGGGLLNTASANLENALDPYEVVL